MPMLEKKPVGFDEASTSHRFVAELLAQANIHFDGHRPWDIQLNAPGVIDSALTRGNLGFGESYMKGDWDADRLDELFYRLMRAQLGQRIKPTQLIYHSLRSSNGEACLGSGRKALRSG